MAVQLVMMGLGLILLSLPPLFSPLPSLVLYYFAMPVHVPCTMPTLPHFLPHAFTCCLHGSIHLPSFLDLPLPFLLLLFIYILYIHALPPSALSFSSPYALAFGPGTFLGHGFSSSMPAFAACTSVPHPPPPPHHLFLCLFPPAFCLPSPIPICCPCLFTTTHTHTFHTPCHSFTFPSCLPAYLPYHPSCHRSAYPTPPPTRSLSLKEDSSDPLSISSVSGCLCVCQAAGMIGSIVTVCGIFFVRAGIDRGDGMIGK